MSFARFVSLWLPVAVWCGLIYFLSAIPHLSSGSDHDLVLRKAAHAIEYAILAGVTWRAIVGSTSGRRMTVCALTLLFCGSVAISDEIHQLFVSGRRGALSDVGIDMAGAAVAALAAYRMHISSRLIQYRKGK